MVQVTHTYASLEVSAATWTEISDKLHAAGYDHAFDRNVIDMHGIGLVAAGPDDSDAPVNPEIHHLQVENAALRTLLKLKKPLDTESGVFALSLPQSMSMEQFHNLQSYWAKVWEDRQLPAPILFPLVGDLTIEKMDYDGNGLFLIRMPSRTPMSVVENIMRGWKGAWSRTDTPNVPMAFLADDLDLEKMTDRQLQALHLMRIPSEVNFAG